MVQRVVILGCGAVGKCVLYYVKRFLKVQYKNVVIVDRLEAERSFPAVQECLAEGATFLKYDITDLNVEELLTNVLKLKAGDAVIDLTTRTPTLRIFAVCRRLQLFYLNTDVYDTSLPAPTVNASNALDGAIRATHAIIDDVYRKTEHHGPVTHVLECGMNPGLISIFVKKGLLDMAKWVVGKTRRKVQTQALKDLHAAMATTDYHGIAKALGVRVIHCSEIDTQVPTKQLKKNAGVFCNTWSCVGLIDEGVEPCEIAVGTHETHIPMAPKKVEMAFPQIALLGKDGVRVHARSYVPMAVGMEGAVEFKEIKGRCVHHGESISLNIFLGRDDYAPTMHYVYAMNPMVEASLKAMSRRQLLRTATNPSKWHVMNVHQDGLQGTDNVGACFLLDANPATGERKPWGWWCGSMLDTETVRNEIGDPYFGPTVIQVMAGVLSGLAWAFKHPERGLVYTENIDGRFILAKAKKYLGTIYSGPITCPIAGTSLSDLMIGAKRAKNTTSLLGM